MIISILNWAKRKLYSILLIGDAVWCPICQNRYSHFLSYGATTRKNAQCPNCKSLERHRLIWLYLNKGTGFKKHTKLLHVSPESVFFKRFSQDKMIDYYPVDKFEKGYRYPKGTQNVDITAMPYQNEQFDAILCIHVLEHIPEEKKAILELNRVLKHDGWAIIMVPIDKSLNKTYEDHTITTPEARKKAYGQEDHVRLYGKDYEVRLKNAGFNVEVIDLFGSLSHEDQKRYALLPGEDLYLCTKKS